MQICEVCLEENNVDVGDVYKEETENKVCEGSL